jgi:hypothetical protein
VAPLSEFVYQGRDVLIGINRSNPRVLGDYGYTVNDSPVPKKNGNGNGGTPS